MAQMSEANVMPHCNDPECNGVASRDFTAETAGKTRTDSYWSEAVAVPPEDAQAWYEDGLRRGVDAPVCPRTGRIEMRGRSGRDAYNRAYGFDFAKGSEGSKSR